ncbi:hypothetical protein [Bacillus sp. MYb209]|nr:hypothetical protein [Bacillus sp. MYb209]
MKSKTLLTIGTMIVAGSVFTACAVTKSDEKMKANPNEDSETEK